jgi:ribosomal-protein-serine acetyltransferase
MTHERSILIDIPGELIGDRIVVRPFRDADAERVYAAIQESVDHLRPWLPWADRHQSIDDTREFIRRTQADLFLRDSFAMGIFSRTDGRFLGGCGLGSRGWMIPAFEMGYWIRKSAEGHGYVIEAVRLMTCFAFEVLEARRLVIRCDTRNLRSKAVPERLGYVLEGCLRNSQMDTSGWPADMLVFAMTPEDYDRARTTWQ